MKKQIRFIGWLYECDIQRLLTNPKKYLPNATKDILLSIDKKDLEYEFCSCGKCLKPVKVELILKVRK